VKNCLFYIKTARPGLWFATLWLYLLPTSQMTTVTNEWTFWYGLFYVCFPLNFMVYGWNDAVDFEADQVNPRKDSFWFGARGTQAQLQQLWKPILLVQLFFVPILIWKGGLNMLIILLAFVAINGLYNLPKHGLRSKPPFELLCQAGYLLVVPLSIILNETAALPWQTYLYLTLFAVQSHLMGEVMDIEPDRKAQKHTTATVLGTKNTKLLIMLIVLTEVILLWTVYEAFIFGALLGAGLIWLLVDLLIIFKARRYTIGEMQLFALASNLISIVSMAYVWYSGCLLTIA